MSEETTSKRVYRPWSDEEIDKLRRFASLGAGTIATALSRPKVAVYNKAKALGIDITKRSTADQVDAV